MNALLGMAEARRLGWPGHVGMSTVPEAIVARQMGMRILGISLITNPAAGMSDHPIDHDAVMRMGDSVSQNFTRLLSAIIPKLT